jgi:putative endonuclease
MRKSRIPIHGNWCVYVLRCRNNFLYTGLTNNIERRLKEHGRGKGSKFVRSRRPFELVKTIPCKSAREARSIEYNLKRLKRSRKIEVLGIRIGTIAQEKKNCIVPQSEEP